VGELLTRLSGSNTGELKPFRSRCAREDGTRRAGGERTGRVAQKIACFPPGSVLDTFSLQTDLAVLSQVPDTGKLFVRRALSSRFQL